MNSNINNEPPVRNLIIAFIVLVIAIIGGLIILLATRPEPVEIVVNPPVPTETPSPTNTPEPIVVYITGAVNSPQTTVSLPVSSRVQDAIDAADGLAENADLDRVNLAGIVRDGDQIHVYTVGEPLLDAAPDLQTSDDEIALPTPSGGDVIFINTATLEELDTLPGIGPAIAQRIIDYRAANGPFSDLNALMDVSGIGPAIIEDLDGLVSFE